MTLRTQRGCRSPLYAYLLDPIYITSPNTLIPLLEGAYFDTLPELYQGVQLPTYSCLTIGLRPPRLSSIA